MANTFHFERERKKRENKTEATKKHNTVIKHVKKNLPKSSCKYDND